MNTHARILFLWFITLCFFPIYSTAAPRKLPVLDRMIAAVNDEAITESELNQQTQLLMLRMPQQDTNLPPAAELKKQILEKMIIEKLQLQLAKQQKIEIDDETVNKTLEEIASRDKLTVAQLKEFMEEQGVSFQQFRETIKRELTISKLQQKEIGGGIVIAKADIEHFLSSPAAQDQTGVAYHLGHILIALPEEATSEIIQQTEKKAEKIVQELKAGANFAKTAMAKSSGQQALNGGDLGWRKTSEVPTLFAKVVGTLQSGDVYGPIKETGGFHIIKLFEKRVQGEKGNNVANKAVMRNKAMEILYQRKFEEQLVPWLKKLRSEAEVEIYLDAPST
jgi:peptidyl-prolyl cis-trans isomerase SurA